MKFWDILKYFSFLILMAFLIFAMIVIVKNINNPQQIRIAAFAKNISSEFKSLLDSLK